MKIVTFIKMRLISKSLSLGTEKLKKNRYPRKTHSFHTGVTAHVVIFNSVCPCQGYKTIRACHENTCVQERLSSQQWGSHSEVQSAWQITVMPLLACTYVRTIHSQCWTRLTKCHLSKNVREILWLLVTCWL